MIDLAFIGFIGFVLLLGLRRPFLWVLLYVYIDTLSPQNIGYGPIQAVPISLIAFVAAFAGWLLIDDKRHARVTLRQWLMVILLAWCAWTTSRAAFPLEAVAKWEWVWKAMIFAIFLPFTLTTRLRLEAIALVIVLSVGAIAISAGIKTVAGGGGYESLYFFVNDNSGIYESSTLATMAIALIPLIVWFTRHGTIFTPDWRVRTFAWALVFACLLVPIGTEARTGLLCIAVLGVLLLRDVKRRLLFVLGAGVLGLMALPFLPQSYYERMATIGSHDGDQSASTRVAVWEWTLDYAAEHPLGGGFDAYRANSFEYRLPVRQGSGNTSMVEYRDVEDKGRAFHSAIFEMLGEQGWPGLGLWLWLHALGLWQMERIRRRWRGRTGEQWQAPLASALQIASVVYLVGALFQGIAFQPVMLMIVGIQCGLWSYLKRIERPAQDAARRDARRLRRSGAAAPA